MARGASSTRRRCAPGEALAVPYQPPGRRADSTRFAALSGRDADLEVGGPSKFRDEVLQDFEELVEVFDMGAEDADGGP